MNFTNFVLDHESAEPSVGSVSLFRITSSQIQEKKTESMFAFINAFRKNFAIHIIIDNDTNDDASFNSFFERVFLLIGRENYCLILKKKIVFISFSMLNSGFASKLIFKLRSFLSTVYIIPIRYGLKGQFVSSVNVCLDNNEQDRLQHFKGYIATAIRQKTVFEHNFNYFVISDKRIDMNVFSATFVTQLQSVPNILSLLNESAMEISLYKETLDFARKENIALLNAVSFLKKEVKNQYQEKVGVHISAERAERQILSRIDRRVKEIQQRYDKEYEVLPQLYKKFGALIKILSGSKEYSYYLNKRQKQAFFELLQSLPKDKQIEMWYYYEYEILPRWYKKIGKLLAKMN
jgi:hypothetical protein